MFTKVLRHIARKGILGMFGHCSGDSGRGSGHCY